MYHYQTTQLVGPEEIKVLEHKSSIEKNESIIDIILHSKITYIILCNALSKSNSITLT